MIPGVPILLTHVIVIFRGCQGHPLLFSGCAFIKWIEIGVDHQCDEFRSLETCENRFSYADPKYLRSTQEYHAIIE